jgi:hypothetical protein
MSSDVLTLTVISLYLSKTPGGISTPVPELHLRPQYGIVGDTHAGETQFDADTGQDVPNLRHFTAVNPRELGAVAEAWGIPSIDPAWLKANICFASSGREPFTEKLVTGTTLINAAGRPVLEIKGATTPCLKMGQTIAAQFPQLAVKAELFPRLAYGQRGVHGTVLEETTITLGETFTVALP